MLLFPNVSSSILHFFQLALQPARSPIHLCPSSDSSYMFLCYFTEASDTFLLCIILYILTGFTNLTYRPLAQAKCFLNTSLYLCTVYGCRPMHVIHLYVYIYII